MVRSARRMGGLAAAFVVVALPLVLYIGSATPDASSPELVGRGGDGARERRVQDSTSNAIGASCLLVETEYDANGDAVEVISNTQDRSNRHGHCPFRSTSTSCRAGLAFASRCAACHPATSCSGFL